MFIRKRNRAQTTAEYAILIAIVVGAVVAMQVFVKRGIQGRIHDVVAHTGAGDVNSTGTGMAILTGNQYEPYYAVSDLTSSRNTSATDTLTAGGGMNKTGVSDISGRTGSSNTLAVE